MQASRQDLADTMQPSKYRLISVNSIHHTIVGNAGMGSINKVSSKAPHSAQGCIGAGLLARKVLDWRSSTISKHNAQEGGEFQYQNWFPND
jgi:hypothetical protein